MSRPEERARTRQDVSLASKAQGNQKTDGYSVSGRQRAMHIHCPAMTPRGLLFSGANGAERGVVKDKASGVTS